MKKLLTIAGLALALGACQQNSYKIVGTATGYADGDTLLLSEMFMDPYDTIVVKDGKFALSGQVDSVKLCVVYPKQDIDDAVLLFIEPGTIALTMSGNANTSRVGGTKSNDGLQALTDKTNELEERMEQLTQAFSDSTLTEEKRAAITDEYAQLQGELPQLFAEAARQNIDNEFGFFVLTNLAPEMDLDVVQQLIGKMPSRFRQRKEVSELEAMIAQAHAEAPEQQLEDFSMATPDGDELNVMDEVAQHRLTIIDFWASWCQPCMKEMPNMKALYEKYHDQGLGIIGVSLDEDHGQWTQAIKAQGLKWPQVSDLQGWHNAAAEMYQVQSIPHMMVVDSTGVILQRGLRGEALEQFVAEHLD